MKESIEDFIRKNRTNFDVHEPSEKVWKRLDNHFFKDHGRRWSQPLYWWRAAAILFFSLSLFLFLKSLPVSQDQAITLQEFSAVEKYYDQQIAEKVSLIEDFYVTEGLNGFTHDFQQLEAMYNVLKEEMSLRPTQRVRDALELNLLIQIDLLNQHLHQLDKKKEKDTQATI